MNIIGGILLFVAGLAVGGGLVVYNRVSVQNATGQLRKENERLKQSAWVDRLDYETNRAYQEGYKEGRRNPMSDVERLADTLERKKMDFRTTKKG